MQGVPPHRVIFSYAVSMSYDKEKPPSSTTDKRWLRPVTPWTSDLQLFLEAVNELVTPENQNVIAVFDGRGKRSGAGLLVEAGLASAEEIIGLVKKLKSDTPFRVKTVALASSTLGLWLRVGR